MILSKGQTGIPKSRRQRFFKSRRSRKRNGTTCVEFALTFPIVLGLFMSMIFCVQAYMTKSTAEMAAYAAARQGVIIGSTEEEIRLEAERVISTVARKYEITIERTSDFVDVSVVVPMNGNSWATGQWCPESLVLRNRCRLERQQ